MPHYRMGNIGCLGVWHADMADLYAGQQLQLLDAVQSI